MLDTKKIFHMFNNQLNEISYTIPAKKKNEHPVTINIRTKAGGGGRAGMQSVHSCSIKVKIGSGRNVVECPLIIPTVPFSQFKIDPNKVGSKEYLRNHLSNSDAYDAVIGFVHDNQIAILAYWYASGGERSGIGKVIEAYIKAKISANDYRDRTFRISKEQDELDADKKGLITHVRKQLKDDTIDIKFES